MRSSSSWSWKSPLDRRLRSRMASRPFQFTGMKERHTPKSELLRGDSIALAEPIRKLPTSFQRDLESRGPIVWGRTRI